MKKASIWPQMAQAAMTRSNSRALASTTLPASPPPCSHPRYDQPAQAPADALRELQRPAGWHQSSVSRVGFYSPEGPPGLSVFHILWPGPERGARGPLLPRTEPAHTRRKSRWRRKPPYLLKFLESPGPHGRGLPPKGEVLWEH